MEKTLYEAEDEFITITEEEQVQIQQDYIDTLGPSFLVEATATGLNDLMKLSLDTLFNPDKINRPESLDTFAQTFIYMKTLLQMIGISEDMVNTQIGLVYYNLKKSIDEYKDSLNKQEEMSVKEINISDLGLMAEKISEKDAENILNQD